MDVEAVFYMLLFCAIVMAKNQGMALRESVRLVPLSGRALSLANGLAVRPPR